jgi:hypothetical protein
MKFEATMQRHLRTISFFTALVQCLNLPIALSLQVSPPLSNQASKQSIFRRHLPVVYAENNSSAQSNSGVQSSEGAPDNGASGGLMKMGDLKSQLSSAFSALDESEQYDAVLTGLCAKILDQPSLRGDEVSEALKDPIQLLQEMNSRRVKASGRSLMALIDVRFIFELSRNISVDPTH